MTGKHERLPVISKDISRLLFKHGYAAGCPNYQVIDWTSIQDIGFAASQ